MECQYYGVFQPFTYFYFNQSHHTSRPAENTELFCDWLKKLWVVENFQKYDRATAR